MGFRSGPVSARGPARPEGARISASCRRRRPVPDLPWGGNAFGRTSAWPAGKAFWRVLQLRLLTQYLAPVGAGLTNVSNLVQAWVCALSEQAPSNTFGLQSTYQQVCQSSF